MHPSNNFKVTSCYTKVQYMKESNTLVDSATIKQPQSLVLLNTKGQYMKGSNTFVDSVENNSLEKQILKNTNSQYMKESNVP